MDIDFPLFDNDHLLGDCASFVRSANPYCQKANDQAVAAAGASQR